MEWNGMEKLNEMEIHLTRSKYKEMGEKKNCGVWNRGSVRIPLKN